MCIGVLEKKNDLKKKKTALEKVRERVVPVEAQPRTNEATITVPQRTLTHFKVT